MRVALAALTAAALALTVAPSAAAVPAAVPQVGECYDLQDEVLQAGGWWLETEPVDCAESHTFEVTETGPLPQDVNAFDFAARACGALDLWAALGINTPTAGLVKDPLRIEPRSFGVRQAPASYLCGAVAVSLNGRRPSTAVPLTSSIRELTRRQRLALRYCSEADGRRALAPAITVPCRTRPRWQVRTWVLWTAFYDDYPGRMQLLARAAELCGPRARFAVPTATEWAEGLPLTSCHLKYT